MGSKALFPEPWKPGGRTCGYHAWMECPEADFCVIVVGDLHAGLDSRSRGGECVRNLLFKLHGIDVPKCDGVVVAGKTKVTFGSGFAGVG